MSGHNDYSPYWWWTENEDWLKVTVIAAPVFIVLGLALISYKLYERRTPSYIYKPGDGTAVYNAVYKPTTCAMDDECCDGGHLVVVGPQSPSVMTVVTEQEESLLKHHHHHHKTVQD